MRGSTPAKQMSAGEAKSTVVVKLAVLAAATLLIWSLLFTSTYQYSFHWDDFHFIRHYSWAEILSTFHGWNDPDRIETPTFRPVATLLFALQGSVFAENVVQQRIFMTVLMWALLFVLGLLLSELGCNLFQVGVVFALFVFSRVFACLNLWITLGTLIFCYIFMLLTAYLFLLWTKHCRVRHFFPMLACSAVAVFAREEAYTLPVVLAMVWFLSSSSWKNWRRVALAALSVAAIVAAHFFLRGIFVPEAPSPQVTLTGAKWFLIALTSAWLPGGYTALGAVDWLLAHLWIAFLIGLFLILIKVGRPRLVWQIVGICCLSLVLCLPAMRVARGFGVAMPALAFMTAISIAISEAYERLQTGRPAHRWRHQALVAFIIVGLAIGIAGGVRRSIHVAESLHENSAPKVERDAAFIFDMQEWEDFHAAYGTLEERDDTFLSDMYDREATVPEARRKSGRARLAALGIHTPEDLWRLHNDLRANTEQYRQRRKRREALFLPKYDYLSF